MALLQWRKGIVKHLEDHTPNTRRFFVEVPDTNEFDFLPGQFVTLDLPIHEKVNKRMRSYSIASWPNGTNVFELLIVLARGGAGTTYLFDNIKEGSEITFRGAQGVFTLPKDLSKEIFFICTGTGIAPFRSMVNHILRHKTPFNKIHLIFGTRTQADLLYYNEMKILEQQLPGFHYYPTLSREPWDGLTGYVHPVYENLCKDRPDALFYLCGWKNMIDDARKRIAEMGYDSKKIHLELYG